MAAVDHGIALKQNLDCDLSFLILFNTILPVPQSLVGGQIKIGHQGMWTPEYSISKILVAGPVANIYKHFQLLKNVYDSHQ